MSNFVNSNTTRDHLIAKIALGFIKTNSYEATKKSLEEMLPIMKNENRSTSAKISGYVYYSRWLNDFSTPPQELYIDVDLEFLNDVCDRCAYYILRDLVRGVKRSITEYSIEGNSNNPCFDDYNWCKKMESTFGTNNCIEMLGKGILLYTQKMIDVYNDEIKLILGDEDKNSIDKVLKLSSYTGIFDSTFEKEDNVENAIDLENKLSEEVPPYPQSLQNRKRLQLESLVEAACLYLKDYFIKPNVNDIKSVFFGTNKKVTKKLELQTEKKQLTIFISYLLGNKNIKRETWRYFAQYINKDGTTKSISAVEFAFV